MESAGLVRALHAAFSAMLTLNRKLTRSLQLFSERWLSPNGAVSIRPARPLGTPAIRPKDQV